MVAERREQPPCPFWAHLAQREGGQHGMIGVPPARHACRAMGWRGADVR